jgi:hypothetical protein
VPTPDPDASTVLAPMARLVRWARPRWGVLVAVGAPLVTVATIVIPLVADANVRMTSVETLTVESAELGTDEPGQADPADAVAAVESSAVDGFASAESVSHSPSGGNRDWVVRSDAPFDQFPVGGEPAQATACSAAQIAWLEQWGRRKVLEVWNGQLTLSNTASDGASMSLRNIRSVGVFVVPEVPEVAVVCGGGQGGGDELLVFRHELGSSTPAVLVGDHDGMPSGSPAVINIAPGQYRQVLGLFEFPPALDNADFTGDLVADLAIGDATTQVTLFEGFTRVSPPEITTTTLRIVGNEILCGPDSFDPCTIPLFISQLHADPGFTR